MLDQLDNGLGNQMVGFLFSTGCERFGIGGGLRGGVGRVGADRLEEEVAVVSLESEVLSSFIQCWSGFVIPDLKTF